MLAPAVRITYQVVWVANDCLKIAPLDIVQLMYLLDRVRAHLRRHSFQLFFSRESQDGNLLDKLAAFCLSWENRSSSQELG